MTTIAPASVSILWLWDAQTSAADRFDALATVTCTDCELLMLAPADARPQLERLPPRFRRQRLVVSPIGPIAAVNAAVQACEGRLVVVMPAAVEPLPGWLGPILAAAELPGVDAVTPKLVGPDGRLIAAGSILWRDGACEPYGLGDEPDSQEYVFRRDVPSAPLEALCLRRAALEACGGLDAALNSPDYAVADLAFRLRAAGGRVVYQPRATVRIPQLARSAGADRIARPSADRAALAARHGTALRLFPARSTPLTSVARLVARDALCTDRLLIVDDRVPGADRGSGDPRMLRIVTDIATLWPALRLTLAAQRPIEPERYAPSLLDAGIEVIYGCPDWPLWFESRRYHYGIVMVSKPQPIAALMRRTQPQAFRIYDAEALVFRRLERMLPFITDPARVREVASQIHDARNAESEYLTRADLIVCVSHDERRAARAIAEQAPVVVIPHRVEVLDRPPGHAQREGLIYFGGFMGGSGSPNEDALIYLVSEILPLLHAEDPTLMLYVVGADPTPAVRAVASDRVSVIGYVPDSSVWLSRTRVHVSPLRFGAGVKLKLIDTMAAGLPFVTTRVGAEGLRLGGLRQRLVGESPADLAQLTLALYRNADLWTAVQRSLVQLVKRHFGRERFQHSLVDAMVHAGIAPPDMETPA